MPHSDNATLNRKILYSKHFLLAKHSLGEACTRRSLVQWAISIPFGPLARMHCPSCHHLVFFCASCRNTLFSHSVVRPGNLVPLRSERRV